MATAFRTVRSDNQEQTVTTRRKAMFPIGDNGGEVVNYRRMATLRDEKTISMAAADRLRELLADMEWTEEWAVENLAIEFTGHKLMKNKDSAIKAIRFWFGRKDGNYGIPAGHIFNVAAILGVDARWLGGDESIEKAAAIEPRGLYAREVERAGYHKARAERKVP